MSPPTTRERDALAALQSLSDGTASVLHGAASLLSFSSVSSCTTCGVSTTLCTCTKCIECQATVPKGMVHHMRRNICKTCLNARHRESAKKKKSPGVSGKKTLHDSRQTSSDTDSTSRDTMSGGDTSMSENDSSSSSCSPSRTCVQLSNAHVLALLRWMKENKIRHFSLHATIGSKPTPQNNVWTLDAAAWMQSECGIDVQPHDIIQRVLEIRKTRGCDQDSFEECLRAFEEKVQGDIEKFDDSRGLKRANCKNTRLSGSSAACHQYIRRQFVFT